MAELNAIEWWNRLPEEERKVWRSVAKARHPETPVVQAAFKEYRSGKRLTAARRSQVTAAN